MVRRLNRIFQERLTMNLTLAHTFDDGVIRQYMYEYVVFDVFLTGKPFFRRTDPALTSPAIVFSPLHVAFPTVIPSHAFLPERWQNAAGRRTGYIYTDPCPRSPSSARRIPASPVFNAAVSAVIHTHGVAVRHRRNSGEGAGPMDASGCGLTIAHHE